MRTFRRHTAAWGCCVSALLLAGCATQAMLNGGPRDTEPPKIVQSEPALEATSVSNPVIRLRFDEYVTLNAPTDSIRITPAQQRAPNFQLKGKSLYITLRDSLLPNTTYHIDMQGGVIRDLNEGNPMPATSVVFSTGDGLDSCKLDGIVKDAYTLQPVVNACVLLYTQPEDSCPMRNMSDFFTLTDRYGAFSFNHLPARPFKIYAVADRNFNRRFDQSDEGIAFLPDSTAAIPEAKNVADSNRHPISLLLFTEKPETTRFLSCSSTEKGIHRFAFNLPSDTFMLQALDKGNPSFHAEKSLHGDTVTVFFFDTNRRSAERFLLHFDGGSDTVTLNPYGEPVGQQRGQMHGGKKGRKSLEYKTDNKVEIGRSLLITFQHPLCSVDTTAFRLTEIGRKEKDTLEVRKFRILWDSAQPRQLTLDYPLQSRCDYRLTVKDSACTACNGMYNDSIEISFTIKGKKDYGQTLFRIHFPIAADYIVQLTDDKYNTRYEQLLQSDSLTGDSAIVLFPHVAEGKYRLRIIADKNGNRRWDTGKYMLHIQPEPVYYSPKTFEVKNRWTLEETIEATLK